MMNEGMIAKGRAATYFVVKSYNKQGLEKSRRTSEWACSERASSPQPKDILDEAFRRSDVYLVYSVNNCHGWHGYARMTSPPEEAASRLASAGEGKDTVWNEKLWHKFKVTWEKLFLDLHQEKCLHFDATKDLKCADQITLVNKARNYQELDNSIGKLICDKIDKEYERIVQDKLLREQERQSKLAAPFFEDSPNCDESRNMGGSDHAEVWEKIVARVGELGEVVLACAFGSQRYNCDTAGSDMDMFIVYRARTAALLGFSPPPQTIKNREGEQFDYTVLELHRFCELLLGGDPRCVETLYLHRTSVYKTSDQWQDLVQMRNYFLTKQVCEKYMHDALGAKGIRLLDKWVKSGEATREPLPQKVGKLFYIIIRLLQNAEHIIHEDTLHVHREDESDERRVLMQARSCEMTYRQLRSIVDRMSESVKTGLESRAWDRSESTDAKNFLEPWLIKLRHRDLHENAETTSGIS